MACCSILTCLAPSHWPSLFSFHRLLGLSWFILVLASPPLKFFNFWKWAHLGHPGCSCKGCHGCRCWWRKQWWSDRTETQQATGPRWPQIASAVRDASTMPQLGIGRIFRICKLSDLSDLSDLSVSELYYPLVNGLTWFTTKLQRYVTKCLSESLFVQGILWHPLSCSCTTLAAFYAWSFWKCLADETTWIRPKRLPDLANGFSELCS